VPALPSSVLEPLWVQVAALLPARQVQHPLGCHRPRIPDRLVFDKLIQILVFGCGYRRIADHTCSATTLRRRRDEWITAGVAEQLRLLVLAAYDQLFGLGLEHLAVDSCTTKAPCGGQVAGPSPVDRRKQGLKRSVAIEAGGIPLATLPAPANQHRRRAAGRDPGRHRPDRATPRPAPGPSGRRLRRPAVSAGAGRSGHGGPDRHPRGASADPGRAPLGDRADPCLGKPVRQAALVHRAAPDRGRVLAGTGECRRRLWPARPPRLDPLSLGRPPPPPPMTAYWRSLLVVVEGLEVVPQCPAGNPVA
jgi:transposase